MGGKFYHIEQLPVLQVGDFCLVKSPQMMSPQFVYFPFRDIAVWARWSIRRCSVGSLSGL